MGAVFLACFGVGLFIASVVFRGTPWQVPLAVGSIAAFLAALYQRWWARAVFDDVHRRPSAELRERSA